MKFHPAIKLNKLPPYIFSRINQLKLEAFEKKLDVIDLGMGNPDLPTPEHIVERLCDTVRNHPRTHRYPQAKGMQKFRKAICEWFEERFGVKFNPEREVLALIGSKEGIAHLCMTFLNPGDLAIVPNPAYPVYYNGVILAGGRVYRLPLLEENNYLPDFTKIPTKVAQKAKIIFLNYPNNPTTAVVEDNHILQDAVKFAKKHGIIVVYDNAYSELTFDGYIAPSIFQLPEAKQVAVEFHSFSKTFSMAGWRVGFVVGNENIIKYLEKFKSFVDYGVPTFIQLSAVIALQGEKDCVKQTVEVYKTRRDKFITKLSKIGWEIKPPKATMYLWAKIPQKFKHLGSLRFSEMLIRETGIAVAPGIGFGKYGEGYVRFALVTHDNRFHDAYLRLKNLL
ncbi:MAG: LL-diaminopimelate aminotransferase [Elusimicrobiota bacterium]|nr:LL-diaminopimelate aminotransferase [Elusimicrobiota bacterium]